MTTQEYDFAAPLKELKNWDPKKACQANKYSC